MKDHKTRNYPIAFLLRSMPKDVHDILIRRQTVEKIKCGCIVSIETTLYKMIRESENKDK